MAEARLCLTPQQHSVLFSHSNTNSLPRSGRRRQPIACGQRWGGLPAPGGDEAGSSNRGDEVDASGARLARREFILQSVQWAVLGEMLPPDGKTVVNSILGAYGLPQFKGNTGFRQYDEFEADYTFDYPQAWVGRKNTQRPGVYFSDFNTADKVVVEEFPATVLGDGAGAEGSSEVARLAQAAVGKLVNPTSDSEPAASGNSRLELPSSSQIKTSVEEIDGTRYVYLAFPSSTTTRSGYDVRRKNYAVAAVRRGTIYVLGASARKDQFNPEKEQLLKRVVSSFRLR